jgi:hypothetical protein
MDAHYFWNLDLDLDPQKLEFYRLKMEPLRAEDAHNGGVEANGGSLDQWSQIRHHFDDKQDP